MNMEDFPFLEWLCGMCELFSFREGISIDYNRHQVDPTKNIYTNLWPLAGFFGEIRDKGSTISSHPNKKKQLL